MHASRRWFMKRAFIGMAGVTVAGTFILRSSRAGCVPLVQDRAKDDVPAPDPILRIKDPSALKDFSGDNFTHAHGILWDKPGYLAKKGGIPAPSEQASVVVIGGGMAGLIATKELTDLKPILLEQAPQFGGNSKAETWGNTTYGIGAAYVDTPEEGSHSFKLLTELGLLKHMRPDGSEEDRMVWNGKVTGEFWKGATDPARADEFKKVWDVLIGINKNSYPNIPPNLPNPAITQEQFNELDRMSFADWSAKTFGTLHPHIEEFFREYCWSSFGGTFEEISAAQGLYFLTGDLVQVSVLPGGNAAIAQALYSKLKSTLPAGHLRSGCFVVDIKTNASGVQICYETPEGELKTIQARGCVVAAPKFVARVLIGEMPDDQKDAISKIKYRAYIVANVLVNAKPASPGYDLFRMTGTPPIHNEVDSKARPYTDMIFGSWAANDHSDHSAFSLYRAFPYDSGRSDLFKPSAYKDMLAEFEAAIPEVLSTANLPADTKIEAIRISRWGHAVPVGGIGMISDGICERAAASIGSRIFFGQQDNWANPCFETAMNSAINAAGAARKALA